MAMSANGDWLDQFEEGNTARGHAGEVEDIPHPAIPTSMTSLRFSALPARRQGALRLVAKAAYGSVAAPASMAFGSKFHEPLGELVEAPCAGEISGLGPGGLLRD
jgi:hypothetical protein